MALVQKRGGPYTKSEKRKRREEVYRLHFDYGYSARKISELMKINRGTINRDIMFLYSNVEKKWADLDPTNYVMNQVERLKIQRTRLRNQLDYVKLFQEKMAIEKLIFDIDIKITNFQIRLSESEKNIIRRIVNGINFRFEKDKNGMGRLAPDMFIDVPIKARQKINKILDEAKSNVRSR